MNSTRFFVLSSLRCGSNYTVEILGNHLLSLDEASLNINEAFEDFAFCKNKFLDFDENRNLKIVTSDIDLTHVERISKIQYALRNSTTPLVLKLLPLEPELKLRIIRDLADIGNFTPVVLFRRSFEKQVISHIIAALTNSFQLGKRFDKTTKINISRETIQMYYDDTKKLNQCRDLLLEEVKANFNNIRYVTYETMDDDLTKMLGYNFTRLDTKQLPEDPYEIIENADEVKEFFKSLR